MKITVSKLENVNEVKTVSAVSVFGTGLLTLIVTSFIDIFGVENKMLGTKIEKAKESALQSLISQASATTGADGIMNLSFQVSGKSVLAYGTVYKNCKTSSVTSSTSNTEDEIPEI